jgi:hypothetical protein
LNREVGAAGAVAVVAAIVNSGIGRHTGAIPGKLGDSPVAVGIIQGHALRARAATLVPVIGHDVVGTTGPILGRVAGSQGGPQGERIPKDRKKHEGHSQQEGG